MKDISPTAFAIALAMSCATFSTEASSQTLVERVVEDVKEAPKKAGKELDRVADKIKAEGKRADRKRKEEGKRIDRQRKATNNRVKRQTETNLEHLAERGGRDVRNTIRLFTEHRCARIGRKKGPEAERRCRNQGTGSGDAAPPVRHYAAAELDCWKPGRSMRWGTVELRVWSRVSVENARTTILDQIETGGVCAARWGDRTLMDRDWHWLN